MKDKFSLHMRNFLKTQKFATFLVSQESQQNPKTVSSIFIISYSEHINAVFNQTLNITARSVDQR